MEAAEKGLTGEEMRKYVGREFRRQITMNFLVEDLPDANRFVRVSGQRGVMAIPKTEVHYTRPSAYVHAAREYISAHFPAFLTKLQARNYMVSDLGDNAGHLIGTCRMGDVVDASLRFHEADNLYVLGGSAFPSYSASNPTLTIAALAIRLGQHLSNH